MKYFAVLIAAFCLLTGCATIRGGRDLSSYSPVSIVSVVSNYDINWDGEGPSLERSLATNTGAFVKRALRRDDRETRVRISKAGDLINEADLILRGIAADSGIAVFTGKDDVISSQAYAAAKINPRQDNEDTAAAEGYRFVYFRDKDFPGNLARETGAGSIMFVTFSFTKIVASGVARNGTMRAKADMNIRIISAQGKTIFNRSFNLTSGEKIPVSGGYYEEPDLMRLFHSVINDVCYEFAAQFKSAKW
ncbi:MAG: hypothetical protein LBO80_10550 [Treponema sp.]|jgi:hypothetical protein|nr:hypothetical protein [Treponema sp.]